MLFSGKDRRARLIGVVLGATAAVSACGGQQSASPPPAAPPPVTVTATVPGSQASPSTSDESAAEESTSDSESAGAEGSGRCRTDQLRARFYPDKAADIESDPSDPTREHVQLRLANVGSNTCELEGSARLEFTGSNGEVLASKESENPAGPSGGLQSLATRQGVVQDVWWKVSPDPCIDPAGVRVYPPGASDPIRLPWHLGAICDGARIEHGRLFAG